MKITTTQKSILFMLFLLASGLSKIHAQADPREVRKENFKGVIELDVRNSKADWKVKSLSGQGWPNRYREKFFLND